MSKELELRRRYLEAYKEYVEFKAPEYRLAFAERLRELGTPIPRYPAQPAEKVPSSEACRKHYFKLSLKYHPDRPTGNKELFQKITQFYEEDNEEILQKLVESDDFEHVLVEELEREVEDITESTSWTWATGDSLTKTCCESLYTNTTRMTEKLEILKKANAELREKIAKVQEIPVPKVEKPSVSKVDKTPVPKVEKPSDDGWTTVSRKRR
jgi:hypothetical protein